MRSISTGVVVVGAGIAGLSAADRLVANGVDAVVAEARDRVGGRLLTETWDSDTWIDQGGQWLGPTQDLAYALAERLGLQTMPTHVTGDKLLVFNGRHTRYQGRLPTLPPLALADVGQAQWRFDRLADTVDLAHPWRTPKARDLDAQTFETWIRRTVHTRSGRDFFRVAAEAVFATEAANISLLHALFYAKSGGSLEALLSSAGGAQQDRVLGGTQQLAEGLAAVLGDRVLLAHPVETIRQRDHGVVVHAGDTTIDAGFAIVTTPPATTSAITFDPPLPADRAQLLQRMPHGSVIKFHALYDTPFWREDGLSGEAAGDQGPIKVIFDNSPPSAERGILVGFFEGTEAVEASRYEQFVRQEVVASELARYFGPRAQDMTGYTDTDWSAEPWTRGCYGAHLPPGAWTQFGSALRAPVDRVHWGGTETAERWVGYIEGGIESGIRAADDVLALIPR
ncbi:MAG: flavin monoamine oxidase family protein [Candidatus Nanopelagicales bacterium]